jgi:histidinol-phosphate aminotransferase
VIVATGSDAILTAAVMAYASADRPLVTPDPSYGTPVGTARRMNIPVKAIPVDAGLRVDLDAMVAAATGAGLVFICNPNNPTSTVHTLADVEQAVRAIAAPPETGILIDEVLTTPPRQAAPPPSSPSSSRRVHGAPSKA